MVVNRYTAISANIVQLCKFLRKHGFSAGTREQTEAMRVLNVVSIGSSTSFKLGLKSIFVKSKWQHDHFDDLFDEFWAELEKAVDSKIKELPEEENGEKPTAGMREPSFDALKSWLFNDETDEEKEIATYSNQEVLTKKEFGNMSENEMRLIITLLRRIARQLSHQKSRLKQRAKKNNQIDLKRTFSTNMRLGGELLKLHFSEPKDKKQRILLLCDVSKSMSLYSRFFVHLIYAFQNSYDKIETFVFSTKLHRVTDLLENYEFEKAFETISDRVPQWSGGTTIGRCIQTYVEFHSSKTLTNKTVVFILSDGWDTGDADILRDSMQFIHRRAKKVIWLNPLAGNPNFTPQVSGLQTALPYIDVLESAHNLDSLKRAMKHLGSGRRKTSLKY